MVLKNVVRCVCLSMAAMLLVLGVPALDSLAQDTAERVQVRSGVHKNYSRIVFDWAKTPGFEVTREDSRRVVLEFKRAASADLSRVRVRNLPYIDAIKPLSGAGQNLKLAVSVPDHAPIKHFRSGQKFVLDVYKPDPKAVQLDKAATKTKNTASEPKKDKAETQRPEATAVTSVIRRNGDQEEREEQDTSGTDVKPLQSSSGKQPGHAGITGKTVIMVSAITKLAMAVFERNNHLWIVLDYDRENIPPQISGADEDMFKSYEQINLDGGAAYRFALPHNAKVQVKGGNLVWQVIVDKKAAAPSGIDMRRDISNPVLGPMLFSPIKGATNVFSVKDPGIGDTLKVVTVGNAREALYKKDRYVDVEIVPAITGAVVRPLSDGVDVRAVQGGVQITRSGGGLMLSPRDDILPGAIQRDVIEKTDAGGKKEPRIFSFYAWQMGGVAAYEDNRKSLEDNLARKADNEGRAEDLIVLAKLNLANGFAHEALGYLNFAKQDLPDLEKSPEYLALRGAARAMAGQAADAEKDLNKKALAKFKEIQIWRVYNFARAEEWHKALRVMPPDFGILVGYPPNLRAELALQIAEAALRARDVPLAEGLLQMVNRDVKKLEPHHQVALSYLLGEARKQLGEVDEAINLWDDIANGSDRKYRAKAGLALTRLQMEQNRTSVEEGIDQLERLRYIWRGDGIETRVNHKLGLLYLERGDYRKGFNVLRTAASLATEQEDREQIARDMSSTFLSLFLGDKAKQLSPIKAVTVYNEFSELTPPGAEGDKVVRVLAERLVEVDLLDRAAELLEHQVEHRLSGEEAMRVATRLAGIRLLDSKAELALKALNMTEAEAELSDNRELKRKRALLRARAYSDLDRPERAFEVLAGLRPGDDVDRLRADTAWKAQRWYDAFDAFENMIQRRDMSGEALDEETANWILNQAVAIRLVGDYDTLHDLRDEYSEAMAKTSKARVFQVVTRPRQIASLADRETLLDIVSEVDMFGNFLEEYRQDPPPNE